MRIMTTTITAAALHLSALIAGCSKYEFNDPTGARARVIYDHTGTAAQVEKQQQQPQQEQPPTVAKAK